MAASKPVEPQSGSGLPRWQLALLVGTPIVLGVGAVYLWNRSRSKEKQGKKNGERKTPEGSASPVQGQHGATNPELENMVMYPIIKHNCSFFLNRPHSYIWTCHFAHKYFLDTLALLQSQSRTLLDKLARVSESALTLAS